MFSFWPKVSPTTLKHCCYPSDNATLCCSRKHPYLPLHERSLEIPRGGGFKGRNFRGEWRVHGKLLSQRGKKHEKIESNAPLIPSTKYCLHMWFWKKITAPIINNQHPIPDNQFAINSKSHMHEQCCWSARVSCFMLVIISHQYPYVKYKPLTILHKQNKKWSYSSCPCAYLMLILHDASYQTVSVEKEINVKGYKIQTLAANS